MDFNDFYTADFTYWIDSNCIVYFPKRSCDMKVNDCSILITKEVLL